MPGSKQGRTSPSSQHSYVEPGSLERNVKAAVVLSVSSAGPDRISVTGGPSTVQVARVRRRVDVAGRVDRPHLQDVLAGIEPRQLERRRAVAEARAVEAALERRADLAGGERERGVDERRDRAGPGQDRRVGRLGVGRRVDGPLVLGGRLVDEQRRVGRLDLERVLADAAHVIRRRASCTASSPRRSASTRTSSRAGRTRTRTSRRSRSWSPRARRRSSSRAEPITNHVYEAGVGSGLSDRSTARTRMVCDPPLQALRVVRRVALLPRPVVERALERDELERRRVVGAGELERRVELDRRGRRRHGRASSRAASSRRSSSTRGARASDRRCPRSPRPRACRGRRSRAPRTRADRAAAPRAGTRRAGCA